jgi:hypothetical protein
MKTSDHSLMLIIIIMEDVHGWEVVYYTYYKARLWRLDGM